MALAATVTVVEYFNDCEILYEFYPQKLPLSGPIITHKIKEDTYLPTYLLTVVYTEMISFDILTS